MSNWFNKLMGRPPKRYESPQVRVLEEYDGKLEHTMPIVVTPPRQQYIIKSEGQYFVYNSKQEMDEELRQEIERLEHIDKISSSYTVIINGKRQVYETFEEIPEEIRSLIEEVGD